MSEKSRWESVLILEMGFKQTIKCFGAILLTFGLLAIGAAEWRNDFRYLGWCRFIDLETANIEDKYFFWRVPIWSRKQDRYGLGLVAGTTDLRPVISRTLFNRNSPKYKFHSIEFSLNILLKAAASRGLSEREKQKLFNEALVMGRQGEVDDLKRFALNIYKESPTNQP